MVWLPLPLGYEDIISAFCLTVTIAMVATKRWYLVNGNNCFSPMHADAWVKNLSDALPDVFKVSAVIDGAALGIGVEPERYVVVKQKRYATQEERERFESIASMVLSTCDAIRNSRYRAWMRLHFVEVHAQC